MVFAASGVMPKSPRALAKASSDSGERRSPMGALLFKNIFIKSINLFTCVAGV